MNKHIEAADKEYLESGRWKCAKSPKGTHHYIASGIGTQAIFRCAYCGGMKRFSEDGVVDILPPEVVDCPPERGERAMKASIYCRVSTEDQGKEGTSLQSQLGVCKKLAEERGYSVEPQHIIQEVYSGLTIERPDLTKLRSWLGAGEVNAVVIYSSDRFSRDGYDFLTLIRDCRKANVELLCVTEPIEGGQVGELLSYVRGWASKLEAEKIRERTIRGRMERAKAGKLPAGSHTHLYGYAYIKETGTRQINEEEARCVRQMYQWLVEEQLSSNAIAYRLRDLGVPTPSGKGWWLRCSVHKILTNANYYGKTYAFTQTYGEPKYRMKPNTKRKKTGVIFKPKDEWIEIPGATPAIITEELFNQAQQRLEENKRASLRSTKNQYLLRGHIYCQRCRRGYWGAQRIQTRGDKRYTYPCYQCSGNLKKVTPIRCGNKRYNAKFLETIVWEQVEELLSHPQLVLSELKRLEEEQEQGELWERDIQTIEAQIVNRETQKARIWKAFALTGDEERFKKDIASLEKDIERLKEEKLNTAKRAEAKQHFASSDDVRVACDLISSNLSTLSFEEKRFALSALQVKVWIDSEKVEIEGAIPIDVGCLASMQSGWHHPDQHQGSLPEDYHRA